MSATRAGSGERMPVSTEPIAGVDAVFDAGRGATRPDGSVVPWAEARALLAGERFYWLATKRPDGAPHVRPVLAVWVDGALFSTTSPTARKARNVQLDARCVITARAPGLDLVVEGTVAKVGTEAKLRRVADAYISKYGWPVTVRDGAFDAPYGAPTSGPPPYEVYELTPAVVLGFGTDNTFGPRSTRWRF